MENVSENMNSKKDEFKLYLRKNPSILIALVSAAVTIISVIIGYAGRLSNIAYLKYWNIDELYAALETKNIIYLVVNSIAWVIAVSFTSTIIESAFVKHYHYSIFARYAKKQIKAFLKAYSARKKQLASIEKMFWNHKKSTAEDFEIWEGIETTQKGLNEQEQLLKTLIKGNRRELWVWRGILFVHYAAAELILFITMWLSKTAITASENFVAFLLSICSLLVSSILAYWRTRNQRKSISESADKIIAGKDGLDFFEQIEKMKQLESEQYEKNQQSFKFDFTSVLLIGIILLLMVLILMPLDGYTTAVSKKTFYIFTNEGQNEAIIFHSEDTYILEDAEINENAITINTAKQRILKTNDIAFEKMTFDTVVKK